MRCCSEQARTIRVQRVVIVVASRRRHTTEATREVAAAIVHCRHRVVVAGNEQRASEHVIRALSVVNAGFRIEVGRTVVRAAQTRTVLARSVVRIGFDIVVARIAVGAAKRLTGCILTSAVHLRFRIEVASLFVHATQCRAQVALGVEISTRFFHAVVAGEFVGALTVTRRHSKQAREVTRTWQVEVCTWVVVASEWQRTAAHLNNTGAVVVRGKW